MTASQKKNIVRFKAVQAEAKRLKAKNKNLKHSAAVKQAWAILYNTDKKKKKAAPKKKAATKKYVQRGTSNLKLDKIKQALPPGVRISKKTGEKYTETRANRSDKGKLLGISSIEATRINNDINGYPRYVIHFLNFLNSEEKNFLPFNKKYDYALKKAKLIGGKKFDTKQYGGGIVLQSYDIEQTKKQINDLMESTPKIKY